MKSDFALLGYYVLFAVMVLSLAGLVLWILNFDIPKAEASIHDMNRRISTGHNDIQQQLVADYCCMVYDLATLTPKEK